MIGLITPWLQSPFHASILNGIRDVLDEHGYHAFVTWGKMEPIEQAREVEILLEHRVDGIIYVSEGNRLKGHAETWLYELLAEGTKCVVIDDRSLVGVVDCVVSDDIGGAMQAVAHLVELGHLRIAFHSTVWESSTYYDRLEGYKRGLAAAGIEFDPKLVFPVAEKPRDTAIQLHRFLSMDDRPTAFFVTNDIPAMILRHAAEDSGIRVPEDLAIVGYSDQDYSRYNHVSTISQNAHDLGVAAAQALLARLKDADRPTGVVAIPTSLIVRNSTVASCTTNRFDPVPAEAVAPFIGT
jgi:DNA-binding LacI/PurR family transcriptional regulator